MIAGVDLAGDPAHPTGIALLDNKFCFETQRARTDEEILQRLSGCKLVAINLSRDTGGMPALADRCGRLKARLEARGTHVIRTDTNAVASIAPEGLDNLGFESAPKSEHEADACLAGFSAWSYLFKMHKQAEDRVVPSKKLILMMRIQKKKSNWVRVQPLQRAERFAVADITYQGDNGICGVLCEGEIRIEDFAPRLKYIPSLLSFRELNPIKALVKDLDFDVLFCNGHGLDHPRGLGMASHLGVELDRPVIGICKRMLTGTLDGDRIMVSHNQVGWKHRSRYLTLGHKVDLEDVKTHADKGIELLQTIDKYLRG